MALLSLAQLCSGLGLSGLFKAGLTLPPTGCDMLIRQCWVSKVSLHVQLDEQHPRSGHNLVLLSSR